MTFPNCMAPTAAPAIAAIDRAVGYRYMHTCQLCYRVEKGSEAANGRKPLNTMSTHGLGG